MFKRVLIKLSGEALAGDNHFGFNQETALKVANQIKSIVENGVEVGLVVGAGNIWRGRENTNMDMTKSHDIGILSTIINSIYMQEILRISGIDTIVQTPFPVGSKTQQFLKETAIEYMKQGKVVIFGGGTGHPFFSTDTAAALRALEINADILLLAKKIDGIYDSDPNTNKDAKKYDQISCENIVKNNLKVIDLTAASLCFENNMDIMLFALNDEDSIIRIVNGEKLGTYVNSKEV